MRYVRNIVLAAALLGCATQAHAQARLLGGRAYADVELGARFFLDKPQPLEFARFEEYRDMRSGFIVPTLRGWFDTDDGRNRVELLGRYPGQDDQYLLLRGQRLGRVAVELERDQTPHIFSTNGRLLGTFTERGVLTLPNPRPAAAAYNDAPVLGAIGTKWTSDRIALKLAPSTALSSLVQYTRTEKRGDRPMGMAFGSPGNNHREILEPIEHTVQHLRIAPALKRARYQVQASYDYSSFENALASVVSDNPLVAADQASAGSSRGRTALAPANQSHMLGLQGAVTLPLRGRVSTAMAYSWRTQQEPILPYTINTAINTSTLTQLPEHLDGDVRTLLLRASASMRPLRSVTIGARVRHYELEDRTPIVSLNGRVTTDRSLTNTAIASHRYPYTRRNAGADVRWRIIAPVALQLDYAFEEWQRDTDAREVATTKEHTPRATLDVTPLWWLSLHTTYLRSERRGTSYAEVAESQLPLIRKHDLADRDRERLDVAAHVAPWTVLSLGASYSFGANDYISSRYGRGSDSNRARGLTALLQPIERLAVTAAYMEETFRMGQRSRYRAAPTQLDNESYDWISNTDDDVVTAGVGVTAALMPRRLDVGANWDRIEVTSRVSAFNPTEPAGGTASQNTAAVATDFPETSYAFNPVSAFVRFRLNDNWMLTAGYRQEKFEQVDWRTDGLLPATGSDLFMGNDLLNYNARLLSLTVRYTPRIPGLTPIL